MSLPHSSPVTIKDLEDLDKHLTEVVVKAQDALLSELHSTKLEVDQLRKELRELKQQVPPRLQAL